VTEDVVREHLFGETEEAFGWPHSVYTVLGWNSKGWMPQYESNIMLFLLSDETFATVFAVSY
jgi:hypothetical protein